MLWGFRDPAETPSCDKGSAVAADFIAAGSGVSGCAWTLTPGCLPVPIAKPAKITVSYNKLGAEMECAQSSSLSGSNPSKPSIALPQQERGTLSSRPDSQLRHDRHWEGTAQSASSGGRVLLYHLF